jgi:hypothetical protein
MYVFLVYAHGEEKQQITFGTLNPSYPIRGKTKSAKSDVV